MPKSCMLIPGSHSKKSDYRNASIPMKKGEAFFHLLFEKWAWIFGKIVYDRNKYVSVQYCGQSLQYACRGK